MHDAILVGIGTAINDDPQLNGKSVIPAKRIAYRTHSFNLRQFGTYPIHL
jgi:hypothetical protein